MLKSENQMKNKEIVIERLKGILSWSDRIGSDEIAELEDIIKFVEELEE